MGVTGKGVTGKAVPKGKGIESGPYPDRDPYLANQICSSFIESPTSWLCVKRGRFNFL